MDHEMRRPCPACSETRGRIETKNGQDCVYCLNCGKHCYNAPKSETGRAPRSVTSIHNGIKPAQRCRILNRATARCELCGKTGNLHVGHLLSVRDGVRLELTEQELNDDENLAALCDECNLGMGSETVPLRLAIAIVQTRIRNRKLRGEAS